MNIRTLIVDDEARARKGLLARLNDFPFIQVIGECSSGQEAVDSILAQAPDLVFLDIQMPRMNGFEVLQHIDAERLPVVVFATAYDEFAVKAFEYHALDYLLKPIDDDRLRETINHVSAEIKLRTLQSYTEKLKAVMNDYVKMFEGKIEESLSPTHPRTEYLNRFMIKTLNQITVVAADDVYWIESVGDLVYVHTREKKHLYRTTMAGLEAELDPRKFVRIHRSAIVNIGKVKNLHPVSHGDFDVSLDNDTQIRLSRTYRALFQQVLERQ